MGARGRSPPTTSTPTTRQSSSQNFKINKFFQNCSFCDSRYCRQHGWSKKVLIISEFQAIQSFQTSSNLSLFAFCGKLFLEIPSKGQILALSHKNSTLHNKCKCQKTSS